MITIISHFKMSSVQTKLVVLLLFALRFSFQHARQMYGMTLHNCYLSDRRHSLASFNTNDHFSCAQRCLSHDQCKSYNYALSGVQRGLCELNSVGRDASKPLQGKSGFVFVEVVLKKPAKSCFDHWKQGARISRIYHIRKSLRVFCDFGSEPGWVWNLIMSQSHANRKMKKFKSTPLSINAPVKDGTPNWEAYRLSQKKMTHLKSQSTHWRITCSFPALGVDYKDYVRARFTEGNPLTFEGSGECKKVEYLNVRGHYCAGCTSAWWQHTGMLHHHDSSHNKCEFGSSPGFVASEDDFGYYDSTNPIFRCSSSPDANTNLWFGRRV